VESRSARLATILAAAVIDLPSTPLGAQIPIDSAEALPIEGKAKTFQDVINFRTA